LPSTFHHIGLVVRNLKKSEAFFTKYFGFELVKRFMEGTPQEFVQLSSGGVILELFNLLETVDENNGKPAEIPYPLVKRIGLTHLCFLVEDMRPFLSLSSSELELIKGPFDFDEYRIAFLRNFDGIVIELLQLLSKNHS